MFGVCLCRTNGGKLYLIFQKHRKMYEHYFTKLKSNVNLFWRQKDFRRQRTVFRNDLLFKKKGFHFSHDLTTVFFREKQILSKIFHWCVKSFCFQNKFSSLKTKFTGNLIELVNKWNARIGQSTLVIFICLFYLIKGKRQITFYIWRSELGWGDAGGVEVE